MTWLPNLCQYCSFGYLPAASSGSSSHESLLYGDVICGEIHVKDDISRKDDND